MLGSRWSNNDTKIESGDSFWKQKGIVLYLHAKYPHPPFHLCTASFRTLGRHFLFSVLAWQSQTATRSDQLFYVHREYLILLNTPFHGHALPYAQCFPSYKHKSATLNRNVLHLIDL